MAHRTVRFVGATLAAVCAAVASLAASPATAAATASTAAASAPGTYIVRAVPGEADAVARRLDARDDTITRRIGIIDGLVAELRAGEADLLRRDPQVASVTADAGVSMLATTYVPGQDVNSMYSLGNMVGSRGWWNKYTGTGVDVALVDSGVTPVAGLADTGKIVNGPDLTPESQATATRYLDTYGHGTHMAGIIAGHDAGIDPATSQGNSKVFLGVAPYARIVSVKVADRQGRSDVSQVIAGIDWVVQHAHDPGMNIRILNLSFGTNSAQTYTVDPLAYAVEVAWRSGIIVVTSAGNSGATDGRMTNPATDPFAIAVGADDLNGSPSITDDTIPAFSSRGDGVRNPDLVAPGAHVQSLRVPGSYIDTTFGGTGTIDSRFFRGSGTSQAAAFLSGCLALIVQKYPTITPDQAKALVKGTTSVLKAADAQAQGKGLVNMRNVAGKAPVASTTQSFAASTGRGSLAASRGDAQLVMDGVTLGGEVDVNGMPFDAAAMAAAEAAGKSWAGGVWNGSTWAGSAWSGKSWASVAWTGKSWAGKSWASSNWAGAGWAGRTWAGKAWADNSWS